MGVISDACSCNKGTFLINFKLIKNLEKLKSKKEMIHIQIKLSKIIQKIMKTNV